METKFIVWIALACTLLLSGCVTGDRLFRLQDQLNNPILDCAITSNESTASTQKVSVIYTNSGLVDATNIHVLLRKGNTVQQQSIELISKNESKELEFVFSGDAAFLRQSIDWKTNWGGKKNNCDQTIQSITPA